MNGPRLQYNNAREARHYAVLARLTDELKLAHGLLQTLAQFTPHDRRGIDRASRKFWKLRARLKHTKGGVDILYALGMGGDHKQESGVKV